jgi:hypothetical protein
MEYLIISALLSVGIFTFCLHSIYKEIKISIHYRSALTDFRLLHDAVTNTSTISELGFWEREISTFILDFQGKIPNNLLNEYAKRLGGAVKARYENGFIKDLW